jgi:hypothetical protein
MWKANCKSTGEMSISSAFDSPYIAMMSVFTTIIENKNLYPEAFATTTTASLVDDMADSRPSTQQVKVLIDQLSQFFPKHCSMHICMYVANDLELMLSLPSQDRIAVLQDEEKLKDIFNGKILGISWNYVKDFMFFDFSEIMKLLPPLDKMKLIRILHSLYNPLGVLIPFTITGKLALQMCSRLGLTWKAKFPD